MLKRHPIFGRMHRSNHYVKLQQREEDGARNQRDEAVANVKWEHALGNCNLQLQHLYRTIFLISKKLQSLLFFTASNAYRHSLPS
jgi:hypothetical protein